MRQSGEKNKKKIFDEGKAFGIKVIQKQRDRESE